MTRITLDARDGEFTRGSHPYPYVANTGTVPRPVHDNRHTARSIGDLYACDRHVRAFPSPVVTIDVGTRQEPESRSSRVLLESQPPDGRDALARRDQKFGQSRLSVHLLSPGYFSQ